ncbi:MAG: hypothetical protein E6H96_06270 [Chloroflexi bacterium]|nr:MAG: hypothetical protein E6H96_06270 [Chloroflexota bacterium]
MGRCGRAAPACPRPAHSDLRLPATGPTFKAAPPPDPCVEPLVLPPLPGRPQVRVVEVLATGGSGGAQEHLYSLLSRLDRSRFEPSVVLLSPGPTTRKIARLGVFVLVLDEPDDATAVGALAAYMAGIRPDVIHNHMYRAELVGTRAATGLAEVGLPRPYVVSTVHSSRVRSAEDRAQLRLLTPKMDQLIAVGRPNRSPGGADLQRSRP